jgi:hypothetical protein
MRSVNVSNARFFHFFARAGIGTGSSKESRKHISVHESVMLQINTRPFAILACDSDLCSNSKQPGAVKPEPRPLAQP